MKVSQWPVTCFRAACRLQGTKNLHDESSVPLHPSLLVTQLPDFFVFLFFFNSSFHQSITSPLLAFLYYVMLTPYATYLHPSRIFEDFFIILCSFSLYTKTLFLSTKGQLGLARALDVSSQNLIHSHYCFHCYCPYSNFDCYQKSCELSYHTSQ